MQKYKRKVKNKKIKQQEELMDCIINFRRKSRDLAYEKPKVTINEKPRVTLEPINVTSYEEKGDFNLFIPHMNFFWEMNK